jgi:hypothetical protein
MPLAGIEFIDITDPRIEIISQENSMIEAQISEEYLT